VPTAIIAAGGFDRGTDGPPPATVSPTSDPTESPSERSTATPEPAATAPFDIADLPTGAAPAIEWSDGRDVHRPDGTVVEDVLPTNVDGFAPMGSGWVVTTHADDGAYAQWVPESGVSTAQVYELDGGLATSPKGEVVAWAEPDGGVRVVQSDGDETYDLPAIDTPGAYSAVAVTTEDCQEGRSSDAGCTVFVNTLGEQAQAWASTSQFAERFDEDVRTMTAWTDGAYAGITEVREDTSTCSAVRDPSTLSTVWETCDNRLVDFSPDGAHLLGIGSIGDGFGDGHVSLLDAADGTVLVDLKSDMDHQTWALQFAWEDESHVLMVTYADGAWGIVRLGLDGSMEYAVPPREGSDLERPFFLQS
jgi:hypothetical protein